MRKISIKQFQGNLCKELKDLPLALTSDGQVVVTILAISQYNQLVKGYKDNNADSSVKLQLYQPGVKYQPGDRVLVKKGRRLVEVTVPELDAEGHPMW